ncbi:uncharacterized protein LOC120259466 isoform X2 [Dioscorea cayenensis subsp. rotundata]|uniref:Uncharacterized protein LOC120259466 isoform X2 n=1 Tax=Dioscorea cayennensis subsp. rotundata TaxID=55577 RepID=A0AB40B6X7_DIOCR|nr:uncharacterized protein LOC120259466 isoform X2 [Dioscorea cayenensis subsp. rotundata]
MSLLCCAWGSKVSSSASFLYDFAVSTVLLHLLFGPICCSLDDNQDGLNILKLLELPSLLTRRSMKSSIPNVMLAVVYALPGMTKMFSIETTTASAWRHLLTIDLFVASS